MGAPGDPVAAEIRAARPAVLAAHFSLALIFIVSLFNYTDRYMLAILLPDIREEFQLNDTQMGLLTGLAFTLFYVVMGIPIARLADRYSRKKILSIALALWSVMTAACGAAQNFIQLLIARVLVGIGEAGSSPPSYSLIADLYPARQRSAAVSIYLAGSPAGILIGFMLGGWLAEAHGWRFALLAVGVPGLLFALVLPRLLTEPARGHADGIADTREVTPFLSGMAALLTNRTFRHAALGCAFYNALIVAYVNWLPSFFVRSHGLGVAQTGVLLALIIGPSQLVGTVAGGFLTDRLSRFDARWYMWLPGAVILFALPLFMLALVLDSAYWALACLFIPLLIGVMQTPPAFAITQSLVPVRMRAVASAVLILIINVISGGFGPLAVGFVSDTLEPTLDVHSLRSALLIVTPLFGIWAALHYFLGGRYVRQDTKHQTEAGP